MTVTGIPSQCTKAEVISYLSSFGTVCKASFVATAATAHSQSVVVTMANRATIAAILEYGHHTLCGGRLTCRAQQDCQAVSPVESNNLSTSRRVLLRGVPAYVSEADIWQLLEDNRLPTKSISHLEAFNIKKTQQTPHHRHQDPTAAKTHSRPRDFEVTFEDVASAKYLLRAGHLYVNDSHSVEVVPALGIKSKTSGRRHADTAADSRHAADVKGHLAQQTSRVDPTPGKYILRPIANEGDRAKHSGLHDRSTVVFLPDSGPFEPPASDPFNFKFWRLDVNAKIHGVKPTASKYFKVRPAASYSRRADPLYRLSIPCFSPEQTAHHVKIT